MRAPAVALALLAVSCGHTTRVETAVTTSTTSTTSSPRRLAVPEVTDRAIDDGYALWRSTSTTARPSRSRARMSSVPPASAPTLIPPVAIDIAEVLACINWAEGSPAYDQHDGDAYSGRYQFDQSTFDGAVARAGHPDYVGVPPWQAPPSVQDAAAAQLFSERGYQPWPPATRRCA